MNTPLVSLRGLSVRYGNRAALAGVSLDIQAGERLAVIGESGSGKSTLALALADLLPDQARQAGAIDWPGLSRPPQAGRDFGLVFQDPAASLDPVLTVGEQVAEGAQRHLGLSWRAARAEALALLHRVQIPQPNEAMQAYPHQFSGGQRQRIAIAAAIAARPRLLIADEATSALDLLVQAEIADLLDRLVRDDGMTLLFITHDIGLAARLADRIAVLHRAQLLELAPTAALLANPAQPYTRHLLAGHIDLNTPPLIGGPI